MRGGRFVLWVLLAASLPLTSAQAKTKKIRHVHVPAPMAEPAPSRLPVLPPLATTYDVYVGGFHLIKADIWFEERGRKYRTLVKAGTRGIWGRWFPWQTVLDAHGAIDGDRLVPQEFFTRDEWKHNPKITRLHFDGKGGVTPEFDPPNTDANREIVTDEQKRGSLDPVTALLQMLAHVAVDNSCAIPVPVFDGKRRFDITGRDAGMDRNEGEEYGAYTGPARLCAADFKMIAGEWKDREHARFWQKTPTESGREPFKIWLASPAKGLPELPVRLESGSVAGLVVVHLSSWRYAADNEIADAAK